MKKCSYQENPMNQNLPLDAWETFLQTMQTLKQKRMQLFSEIHKKLDEEQLKKARSKFSLHENDKRKTE